MIPVSFTNSRPSVRVHPPASSDHSSRVRTSPGSLRNFGRIPLQPNVLGFRKVPGQITRWREFVNDELRCSFLATSDLDVIWARRPETTSSLNSGLMANMQVACGSRGASNRDTCKLRSSALIEAETEWGVRSGIHIARVPETTHLSRAVSTVMTPDVTSMICPREWQWHSTVPFSRSATSTPWTGVGPTARSQSAIVSAEESETAYWMPS